MSRLIASILVILALHGGLHASSPLPAARGGQGFGAYVRNLVVQGATGYQGGVPYAALPFGESVPRPLAANVRVGW